jgi:hypothetical protein
MTMVLVLSSSTIWTGGNFAIPTDRDLATLAAIKGRGVLNEGTHLSCHCFGGLPPLAILET